MIRGELHLPLLSTSSFLSKLLPRLRFVHFLPVPGALPAPRFLDGKPDSRTSYRARLENPKGCRKTCLEVDRVGGYGVGIAEPTRSDNATASQKRDRTAAPSRYSIKGPEAKIVGCRDVLPRFRAAVAATNGAAQNLCDRPGKPSAFAGPGGLDEKRPP